MHGHVQLCWSSLQQPSLTQLCSTCYNRHNVQVVSSADCLVVDAQLEFPLTQVLLPSRYNIKLWPTETARKALYVRGAMIAWLLSADQKVHGLTPYICTWTVVCMFTCTSMPQHHAQSNMHMQSNNSSLWCISQCPYRHICGRPHTMLDFPTVSAILM